MYIYENGNWPDFKWNSDVLLPLVSTVRNHQGLIVGKMRALGFGVQNNASLEMLTLDVLKSNEIEGEFLDPAQVRSSICP